MLASLQLGDVRVKVLRKDVKNVHLAVHPPAGRVSVSAPPHMSAAAIRALVISKLGWIRQQRRAFREQEREPRRELLTGESHQVWGRRYLLAIEEHDGVPSVELARGRMVLKVRPGTVEARRREILDEWYRDQIKAALPALRAKWEPLIHVKPKRFFVRRMRTKWGSCNPAKGSIRVNTDLAKKPRACLEYILVHELVHLREPAHGPRFVSLMDRFLPAWRHERQALNRLPLRHEEWSRALS